MPYACQNCAKRKLKCDKLSPTCTRCLLAKTECIRQTLPRRRRSSKKSGEISERLARYERILHQHGLSPHQDGTSSETEDTSPDVASPGFKPPEKPTTGELLAGQGRSRYVDSSLWRNIGDDEMQRMSDDDGDDHVLSADSNEAVTPDPLTRAFIGSHESIESCHPAHFEALLLWQIYVKNVEPLCKILHIPSTHIMVDTISHQPDTVSRADECLLFAIYHFAVFSATEEDCSQILGQLRATLMQKYHYAVRQALVNANFLKSTKISTLQALVLLLLSCQHSYDPHTFWILTGVAVRIAQRIGLHRDGMSLGLSPYDVEMRRRLFYQIVWLDRVASQLSGTGISIQLNSWDTKQPLNINDDQIWPGMTGMPEEQTGATEMIFCLARMCISDYFAKAKAAKQDAVSWQFKSPSEAESFIGKAEKELEEKYIRYCDIVNPLHFVTIGLVRSAITAMQLRVGLPKLKHEKLTDKERKELFQLSQKIIDTDIATYAHTSLATYLWYMKWFWLPGSLNSFIFTLTSLRSSDFLSPEETNATWRRVEQVYKNHGEVLKSKRALHTAIRRLTLNAWHANPSESSMPVPDFITNLRIHSKGKFSSRSGDMGTVAPAPGVNSDISSTMESTPISDVDTLLDSLSRDASFNLWNEVNLDTADWSFWDQLIQENGA